MPNYFQLTRKSNLKAGPVSFVEIDEEICKHFGVEPEPLGGRYYYEWYESIGFRLAIGKTLEQTRAQFVEYTQEPEDKHSPNYKAYYERLIEIVDYLNEHYTSDAWAQIGK